MLLKDKLNFMFKNFDQNFKSTTKNFLKKFAKDLKKVDYNNLLFKIDDKSVNKDVNFLEETETLYDLLIFLLEIPINALTSAQIQGGFFKAKPSLKIIISSIKTDIKDQSEEGNKFFLQNKKMF